MTVFVYIDTWLTLSWKNSWKILVVSKDGAWGGMLQASNSGKLLDLKNYSLVIVITFKFHNDVIRDPVFYLACVPLKVLAGLGNICFVVDIVLNFMVLFYVSFGLFIISSS